MKYLVKSRVAAAASIITLVAAMFATSSHAGQRDKPRLTKPGEPSQDQRGKDDQDVQRLTTDLVLLDVTVVDQNNRPVMDLSRDQFDVVEDKVPQKIEFFSREQAPVSLVFAIDASGSMRPKLDTVIKASVNLVRESKAGDEMAVVQFKDQAELLEEFTSDINDVTDALQGIIASRQTAMLDALYLAADYANKEAKNRKKAVILVTDGLDNNSFYKFEEVVSHLREDDVQIYFIGFISDLSADHGLFNRSEKDKAENLLNKLASETGGKAFYPRELADVHSIAQQISTDLRTQYSLGYYPTNNKRDGTFRAVKVAITGGGGRRLVARTRSGYTAPRETDRRSASN